MTNKEYSIWKWTDKVMMRKADKWFIRQIIKRFIRNSIRNSIRYFIRNFIRNSIRNSNNIIIKKYILSLL